MVFATLADRGPEKTIGISTQFSGLSIKNYEGLNTLTRLSGITGLKAKYVGALKVLRNKER